MPTKTKKQPENATKALRALKQAPKLATDTLNALLEAGAHFGHQTRRWNPKMQPFIFGAKNNIHIIDLVQTQQRLEAAKQFVHQLTAAGGTVLLVGTKRQARPIIAKYAAENGFAYVSARWLGGMLTNFATISARVKHLKKLEQQKTDDQRDHLTKKEQLLLDREIEDLNKVLGGIRDMHKIPEAVYIVDVPREATAVAEARKLHIPIIAMLDTNANPELVDYPIPSNDDAIKAINLITGQIVEAAAAGRREYDAKTVARSEAEADNE